MQRYTLSLVLSLSLLLGVFGMLWRAPRAAARFAGGADATMTQQTTAPALAAALHPNGALKATAGSFDATGYRMELAANAPPSSVTARTSAPTALNYWERRFTLSNGTNGLLQTMPTIETAGSIGDSFTVVGNMAAHRVAKFNTTNGTWSARADSGGGHGVNYIATSLGLSRNDVLVGDLFSTAGNNKSSANFGRFHPNAAPTISAQPGVSRQKGSPAANVQIATVNDAESGAGGVTVTVTSANPANGVTISNIVNAGGTVTADVVASCGAVNSSFTLTATDGDGATTTATLSMTVTSNTPPVLSYSSPQAVTVGSSVTVSPSAGPSDNGNLVSMVLQSQGTYAGTILVNTSGVVSLSNATPVGTHTIVVRTTDNCGVTTDGSFTLNVLNVSCPAITLSPATLPNGAVGTAYSQTLTANPAGTYGFALINGQLPKGLTLSAGGVISGTPTEFGIFTFTVAANTGTCSGSRQYTLTITGTSCAAPNFVNRTDYTAGGSPRSIVAADFNQDGKVDLASASDLNTNFFIMLGDGLGGFPTLNTITTARTTSDMDTGDFNGDGNIDLVLSSINSSGVTILFGDGAGGFPTSTVVSLGFNQNGVRARDFNGDGKLDFIAFASSASNRFFIVLGNGSGGFSIAPGSPVILDFTPNGSVAINDFNEDGGLDVAFRKSSPSQIIVMYGDGNGGLTMGTPVNIAVNSVGVFTADFNLDGHFDLAASHNDDSLTLVFGNGGGGFTPAPGSPISGAAASSTADFNGDGIPDLVSSARVGFGNGSGGFTILNNLNTGNDRRNVAVADLNGDGKPDLAALNYGPNKVVVLFNYCAPQITAAAPIERQQGSPVANAQIATVSDVETAASNLIVTATSVPNGLSVTNIVNTGGVITADVVANCAITPGAKTVVLQVSDGALTSTANLIVNVTANTAPSLTYPATANVTASGSIMISPLTATDNVSISAFTIVSVMPVLSTVPTINASGVVSVSNALPTGPHTVTVRATDNCGLFTEASFSLTVTCQTITVDPANPSLPVGRAGTAYNQTFSQTGGNGASTFSLGAGALPTGLSLNSDSGLLDGTPTVNGTFNFSVRATDANGCFGERAYTLLLNPACTAITLSPATLVNGFQGTAYSQTLTATGGGAPYSFAVTGGSLPGGLNLASGGALTGTPTAAGTFTFTVTTTDNTGCTGTRSYTVSVSGDGLQFYPLAAPVRLLDTRTGQVACTQPNAPIAGQTSLTQAGRSVCGIPANAVALTGNLTTVNSGGGFLTLYPSNAAQPTVASVNYAPNEIINNVFTVGLGTDGAFKIFAFNTTDVVVDVTGYYAPPATGGLFFHPLPKPIRLLETRAGQLGCTTPGTPIQAGDGGTLTQQARITCDGVTIPSGALAIVGNATTVNPQGVGFLTLFPGNATRPLAAASNYGAGQTVNGPFSVGLAPNGEFKLYTFATTDLVVDVLGYYSTEVEDANGAGLLFSPLAKPVRLLETRAGQPVGCNLPGAPLNSQQEYTQTARGTCDGVTIPTNALGVVGNATVVQPLGPGFLTLWPSSAASRPTVATANYGPGEVTNRHFIVGLGSGDGAFKMYSFATSHLVLDLSGYFAP